VEEILALASLNTFGISPKADSVPPSEEAVFVLTSGQLQDLIKEAIQPLQDEISDLKATVARQDEKIAALESTQAHMEENQLIQLRLIADLRKGQEPQPMQKDRGEILRALIAANGGKMLAKDARQKMHIADYTLSKLLVTMKDEIDVRRYRLKGNQKLLVLK
jgi:hypothetical protein